MKSYHIRWFVDIMIIVIIAVVLAFLLNRFQLGIEDAVIGFLKRYGLLK